MARNRGQEAVLNRKTVKFVETVSLSLTTIQTNSAASPLALLMESYLDSRKLGQEAELVRKNVNFLETVSLSLVEIPRSDTQKPGEILNAPPKSNHKSPSTLKRNGKRRHEWLLARN